MRIQGRSDFPPLGYPILSMNSAGVSSSAIYQIIEDFEPEKVRDCSIKSVFVYFENQGRFADVTCKNIVVDNINTGFLILLLEKDQKTKHKK